MIERTDLEILGENIRNARKLAKISQESLALTAGLDRSYFGRIERGKINISATNLIKIAVALQTNVASLFGNIPAYSSEKPSAPGIHNQRVHKSRGRL